MLKIISFSIFLFLPFRVFAASIEGPEVRLSENDLYVSARLLLDDKQLNDLKNGIEKEFVFYIDLFKVWKFWPNEFVMGRTIVKDIKSDPIKKEYLASIFDGRTLTEKRFTELDSMLDWALQIRTLKFTNTKELDKDKYFIRVTVESRLRRLPSVIGYIFFFVPEREFRISRDSAEFRLEHLR